MTFKKVRYNPFKIVKTKIVAHVSILEKGRAQMLDIPLKDNKVDQKGVVKYIHDSMVQWLEILPIEPEYRVRIAAEK